MEYPQDRTQEHFAEIAQLIVATSASQQIGANGALLVLLVAAAEHRNGYSGPVYLFREQMMQMLGVGSKRTLSRAIEVSAAAGWLHWEAPQIGSRKPTKLWTLLPSKVGSLTAETQATPVPDAMEAALEEARRAGALAAENEFLRRQLAIQGGAHGQIRC